MAIQGMVTRTGWDGKTWGANQRITVDEALRVNTINAAYNSREEAIKGSITPLTSSFYRKIFSRRIRRRSRISRSYAPW
jgi:hypothetical protein